MSKKSQFRGPDVQHFQVLHRSLRDPLANDPNAPQRILSQVQKGKQKIETAAHGHEGLAAEYGVLYDDTEYDYMQHLRPVGAEREAVFVPVPSKKINLPKEVLPARQEDERDYSEMLGIPDRPFGLQPDMDPRLREVLEALEDEAYVQGDDEDFFEGLVAQGEAKGDDDWEEYEEEIEPTAYEQEMARFKAPRQDSYDSEDDDELDSLHSMPIFKGARKGARTAASSSFSMSSSSKFRTQGLRDLDDKFDEVERAYEDSEASNSDDDGEDEYVDISAHRTDINEILDDFLDHYQVMGKKLQERAFAENDTPAEQLESVRSLLRDVDDDDLNKQRILERVERMELAEQKRKPRLEQRLDFFEPPAKDRWDCETVLSTYSNLENHPRLLRLRDVTTKKERKEAPIKKIKLDPKTGLPVVEEVSPPKAEDAALSDEASEGEDDEEDEEQARRETITRPRAETKEEKKARKQAVKAERSARRTEKKATKEMFNSEKKRQVNLASRRNVNDVSTHNPGRTTVTSLS